MINYIKCLLSDISYLDFENINSKYQLKQQTENSFDARGISINESTFFIENFKVINQETEPLSGFSGTTFQVTTDNIPGYKKGDVIIGYRGTQATVKQMASDLIYTDFTNIGFGINTFVDAFTRIFQNVFGAIDKDLKYDLGVTQAVFARTYLEERSQELNGQKVELVGHSLGGYLATFATLTHPEMVSNATTYNAPAMYLLDNIVGWLYNYFKDQGVTQTSDGVTVSQTTFTADKIEHMLSTAGNSYGVALEVPMLNGYIGMRTRIYAEDLGMLNNHLIRSSREVIMLYEILNVIQTKDIANRNGYEKISNIIQNYRYPALSSDYYVYNDPDTVYQLNISKHLSYLGKMLNFEVADNSNGLSYGIDLLYYVIKNADKLSFYETNNLKEISYDSSYTSRAALYSVLNYIPFFLSSSAKEFNDVLRQEEYNPTNYSKDFLKDKLDFFKKVSAFRDLTQKSEVIEETYKEQLIYTFFTNTNPEGSASSYVDVKNKIIYLNNMSRTDFFTPSFIAKRVYFMTEDENDPKAAYILGNNSKVYDSMGNDSIIINGKNVDVYLTKGNDSVTVEVEKYSLGNIESIDNGQGDKFIFTGGDQDNIITGTKYTDEIHGYSGNDTLNGFEGNDTIYGGSGSDTINGGDGNDNLYGNEESRMSGDLADTSTNIINGGYGADYIFGGEGTDIINYVNTTDGSYLGRKNNEAYDGKYGDTIEGRGGDDIIYGTFYGDTYNYTLGDGNDTIIERKDGADTQSNMIDRIKLYDIGSLSVSFSHKNTTNLYLSIPNGLGGQSEITFVDFMKNNYVEQFDFIVNGKSTTIDYAYILKKVLDRTAELDIPLIGNDLMSLEHTETLRGLKDVSNTIIGGYGRDIIIGGDRNDTINESSLLSNSYLGAPSSDRSGKSYGDEIRGGKGNDTIYGTIFSDTIYYEKGDGDDKIKDNSSALNSIVLGKGIDRSNLRVSRDNEYSLIIEFTFDDSSQNGKIILTGNMGYNNYQIIFDNKTIMTYEQMLKESLYYVDNNDSNTILGTNYDDVIEGNGGNDFITGDRGNDILRGGAGNDTLIGGMGLDVLEGGDGDDYINISKGKTTMDNDSYYNGYIEKGDIMRGGRGNDTIHGTFYGDTYYYDLGDGIDTIYESNPGDHLPYAAYGDVLIFGEGILANDIKLSRDGYNSVLEMIDGGKIIIKDFFNMNLIEYFKFSDNTVWTWQHIRDNTPVQGTDDSDTLIGLDNHIPDKIYGMGGDDTIYGQNGENFLYGGEGNDTINEASKVDNGGNGASYIEGNTGNDTLYGSTWGTTFKFYLGDGKDTIIDSRQGFNNTGHIIEFGEGVNLDNISFARVDGSDLRIFYSNNDYVTVKNYYYQNDNPNYRRGPSYLKFANGIYFDMYKNQDKVNTLIATDGNDTFYTLFEKEIVRGQAGNDRFIYNMDYFYLQTADSEYYGEEGDDYFKLKYAAVIDGGEGNDEISAWTATLIDGGIGDDNISLTAGGWKVIGGKGNDTFNLRGGEYGTTTYNLYFNVGDGKDVINNNGISRFNFYFNTSSGDDFTDAKIVGSLFNNYVNIEYGKNSSILINNGNLGHLSGNATFHFTDRSLTIDDLYNNIYGTDEIDNYDIRNYINSAQIRSGGGDDYILGGYNKTIAYGEAGNDYMMLRGGYNYFDGGEGNDTYQWNGGYGEINDFYGINKVNISTYGSYGEDNYKNLRLSRSGNDLLVQRIYNKNVAEGILTIKEQFNGAGVSYINSLSNVNIDKMIELMAQYDSTNDSTEQANYSNEMSKLWYSQP